jgi:hypothetical protein
MKNSFTLNMSTVAFVAAVHTIGSSGLGMWLSARVPIRHRRTIAFTLMALGATRHVPMRRAVMRGRQRDGKALST